MADVLRAIELILHNGIEKFKKIGSAASLPQLHKAKQKPENHKKGALCLVRSKEDLSTPNGVKGYVVTSLETLLEDFFCVSHWNPNIVNYIRYSDEKRQHVKGLEERNLQQINTFVVDIDTKKQPYTEILTAALDHSIGIPTLVLETPKGFQVYFVLEKPLFISNQNDFRGLRVAKRISENIKRSLAEVLQGVDISCNDFGFFRMPQKENIRWFSENMVYDFGSLIAWSKRQDDDRGRGLFVVPHQEPIQDPTQTEWFRELLATRSVKGEGGLIGRDNLMYTLALACYSAGKGMDETLDLLDEYNTALHNPVRHSEVRKIVKSAYKGRFKGAHQTYIRELLDTWGSNKEIKIENHLGGWHKFKKERKDRVRSHYDEWEEDLLSYIQEATTTEQPIKWSTQQIICEEMGMSRSTFNEVIRRSKRILIKRIGKGRAAKTGLTSVAVLLQCALEFNQEHRAVYYEAIRLMTTQSENGLALRELEYQVETVTREMITRQRIGKNFNTS
ncbi:primase C-terminal domain-containing protein [Planococcus donghaensis]|uniref:primase C-terminal domain-containing protein n=1 Tax=Planococcus donghaensis TaxID=414778 RepID=UPI0037360733